MAMYRANYLKLLSEGLRKVFFLNYNEKDLVYPRIFDTQKSKQRQELDYSVGSIGMLAVKEEGIGLTYEDFVPGYQTTYTHTSYAKGIRISRELVDDDLYNVMSQRVKALARSARYRKEFDHAAIFNNASSATTGFAGGDTLALLSATHPLGNTGTTYSNYPGALALSSAGLENAFTAFRRMQDMNGLLVGIKPATLLVPPELELEAYEIVNSDRTVGNDYNNKNFFKGALDVVVWDMISDTNCWFVLAGKSDGAPISFDRVPVEFDQDGDFDTKDLKFSAYTRYSCGFSDWRWCYGANI